MCKFNNRLFVFTFVAFFISFVISTPLPLLSRHGDKNGKSFLSSSGAMKGRTFFDLFEIPIPEYDLRYDQRQKGIENLRLSLDGFFIGLPVEETSEIHHFTDDPKWDLFGDLLFGRNSVNKVTTKPNNGGKIVSSDADTKSSISNEIIQEKSTSELSDEQKNNHEKASQITDDLKTKVHVVNLFDFLRRYRRA